MQGDLFGVYFRGTRSETHTQFSLPPSKCIYQSLTPTHTHREAVYRHLIRRDLHLQALADGIKVSRLPNVIFHDENIIIPARNLNTGGPPGAIFNSLLGNAEKGRSEPLKKEKVAHTKKKTALAFRAPVSCEHAAALTSPHLSHLIFSAPVQGRFSTGLQRAPTQRTSQPAVITPCKCHLGLLMQPVEYRLNWFAGYHPARTHICGAQRRRGGGSSVHSFIWKFCFFCASDWIFLFTDSPLSL